MAKGYTLSELEAILGGTGSLDPARLKVTSQKTQAAALKAVPQGSGFTAGGTGGSFPGVTSTISGDIVNFALPNQIGDIPLPKGVTTTSAGGVTQMTYEQGVELIHELQGTPELTKIQQELKNSGYLKGDNLPYGTLNAATITAWKQLLTDSVTANNSSLGITGKPITAMGLVATGQGSNFVSTLQALELKSQTAQNDAASVQAPILGIQDQNQVAQAFASAREAVGLGAPTAAETTAFVNAFHASEVGAEQNAYEAQKADYNAGAATDAGLVNKLVAGQHVNPNASQSMGPVDVATKAMPNLDAEAMAAAKNADPSQYYATQTSYYGNMIHDMLTGNLTGQSTPTAPSQTAPGGAVLSAPMAGL